MYICRKIEIMSNRDIANVKAKTNDEFYTHYLLKKHLHRQWQEIC